MANYLQNGYISPQAAAANGGEERVRQIVQGRLQGQVSPASGATQAPVVQTAATEPANLVGEDFEVEVEEEELMPEPEQKPGAAIEKLKEVLKDAPQELVDSLKSELSVAIARIFILLQI